MTVRGETPSGARQVSPIFISFRASETDAVFSFFIFLYLVLEILFSNFMTQR